MTGRAWLTGHRLIALTLLVVTACSSVDEAAPQAPRAESTTASTGAFEIDVHAAGARLSCRGKGQTPLVFMAGASDPASEWDELRATLGNGYLTCTFDHPGVATSEPPAAPLTPANVAASLEAVLAAAHLDHPAILVAHSLAGPVLRRFGASSPDRLAAAVFLDPTTSTALPTIAGDLMASGWNPRETTAQTLEPVSWPAVPVVVLSRDPAQLSLGSEAIEDLWTTGQQEYAALSPLGEQRSVPGADHYVQRTSPDVVADTIRDVVARVAP